MTVTVNKWSHGEDFSSRKLFHFKHQLRVEEAFALSHSVSVEQTCLFSVQHRTFCSLGALPHIHRHHSKKKKNSTDVMKKE